MSELDQLEARLRTAAANFTYPPTPNVAASARRRLTPVQPPLLVRRRLAWATLVVAAILLGLLSVPQVRAGILEFLQIGAIRIFLMPPTATPVPPTPTGALSPTVTPPPTSIPSLLNLAGETTLEDARARADFTIRLPTYPADLGPPDRVYLQDLDGDFVVLVWLDPVQPDKVRLSLHLIEAGSFAGTKFEPKVIQETTVGGRRAVWAEGPYILRLTNGDMDFRRLIEGHVLIWVEGDITYRLETDLPLDEAVKIAESLK
jgi:hypothetical protein